MAILEKLCYNEERGHGALIYEQQSRPFRVRSNGDYHGGKRELQPTL